MPNENHSNAPKFVQVTVNVVVVTAETHGFVINVLEYGVITTMGLLVYEIGKVMVVGETVMVFDPACILTAPEFKKKLPCVPPDGFQFVDAATPCRAVSGGHTPNDDETVFPIAEICPETESPERVNVDVTFR